MDIDDIVSGGLYRILPGARRHGYAVQDKYIGLAARVDDTDTDSDGDLYVTMADPNGFGRLSTYILPEWLGPLTDPSDTSWTPAVGDRVEYHWSGGPAGAAESNGRLGTVIEAGGVGKITVAWDDGDQRIRFPFARNLRKSDIPAPATGTPTTIGDVWAEGNVISFTVTANENNSIASGGDGRIYYNVGCKEFKMSKALNSGALKKIESDQPRVLNATFQGKIEDDMIIFRDIGRYDRDDVTVTRGELLQYGRDFVLVEKAPEPVPNVSIEFTADEIDILMSALGGMRYGGAQSRLFVRLHDDGHRSSGKYRMEDPNQLPALIKR